MYGNSGGNPGFIAFLGNELRAYIDARYRTNGFNILNGHSFGGLTAVNILLHYTSLFNAYVIIDPSLWWDDFLLLKQTDSIFRKKDFLHRSIYVGMANKEITPQDTTTDMQRSIRGFESLLIQHKPLHLDWKFHFYSQEDHGTIPIPAEYDGLRFIFREHLVNVKAAVERPELVKDQFSALSQRLGFVFVPSGSWLDWMGDYCVKAKLPHKAIQFYRMATVLYPGNTHAKQKLETLKETRGQ